MQTKNESRINCIIRVCRRVVIIVIWMSFAIVPFAILTDLTQGEKVQWSWALSILEFLKECNFMGVRYTDAEKILTSSVGILVTTVSLIITIGTNISQRSEQRMYGIPRKEITKEKTSPAFKGLRRVTYVAPVVMIACLLFKWIITGYVVMGYIYLFLLYYCYINGQTYGRTRTLNKVVDILLNCFSLYEQNKENCIMQYQLHLEDIRSSIPKESAWCDIELLYKNLIQKLIDEINRAGERNKKKEWTSEEIFMICYWFFKIIYMENNGDEYKYPALKLLKANVTEIEEKEDIDFESDISIKNITLWAMLCAKFEDCTAEEIIELLVWFLDFSTRSGRNIENGGEEISSSIIDEHNGMLLIMIENWLNQHWDFAEVKIIRWLNKLWEKGNTFFKGKYDKRINRYLELYKELFNEEVWKLNDYVKNLKCDKMNGTDSSKIVSIIRYFK